MKKTYIWSIALAAVTSCVFAAGAIFSRPDERPARQVGSHEDLDAAHSSTQKERMSTSLKALKPHVVPPPGESADPALEDEGNAMTADEFAFRVERMFEKDQPATREAMDRDRAIRDAFSAPDLKGVSFESSECRASTCRVKLTFDNLDYDRDILNRMLINPESNL